MRQKTSEDQTFTYRTRPHLSEYQDKVLVSLAVLVGKVERALFTEVAKGMSPRSLKSPFIKQFSLTARHFNAICVQLEGKTSSFKELRKVQIKDLDCRISSLEATIEKLGKKKGKDFVIHQKKRRLSTLRARRTVLDKDIKEGKVRLCFGSRKLFRQQFALRENGYANHGEWKEDWGEARSKAIFFLGSKDETSGNQSAVASIQDDGLLSLRIRLPDACSQYGKYLVINDLHFAYGHEHIVSAVRGCLGGKGVAISYRLVRDAKGWQLFASLSSHKPEVATRSGVGVIGIDINADHLAVAETDRFGNPIRHKRYNLVTYGKTQDQTKALVGDVSRDIVDWGLRVQKPLVVEKLSFDKKKCSLREIGVPKYCRMLSSFAYGAIVSGVKARAWRCGVEVQEVNPAFTSVIGRVKFSKRYGLSVHGAAALTIGRRFLGVSERLPRHPASIADGKGGYVTLSVPERNRDRHVWTSWRTVLKKLPAVLAAQVRAREKAILRVRRKATLRDT